MKKSTAISLVIVIIIIAALVFALASKKADAPASDKAESSSQSQAIESDQPEEPTEKIASGKYTEYNEAELANSKGDSYLFFHAPWCPQCRSIEKSINAGGHIPKGVTIYKVDYDSNQELRKKYDVTLQTTFVHVDNKGVFIDKYVAYDSPSIDSVVENFISK